MADQIPPTQVPPCCHLSPILPLAPHFPSVRTEDASNRQRSRRKKKAVQTGQRAQLVIVDMYLFAWRGLSRSDQIPATRLPHFRLLSSISPLTPHFPSVGPADASIGSSVSHRFIKFRLIVNEAVGL